MNVTPFRPPWGDDDMVVDVARVSFSKQASQYTPEANAKLIGYLARHGHWSPFAHPQASFRITAPIFVARQLAKHQVGLSWNEESRRYIDGEPEFYEPTEWRGRPHGSIKQGSGDPFGIEGYKVCASIHAKACGMAEAMYERLLEEGVAPEQARMVLPLCTMTSWIWTGSLYAWARMCRQRLDAHAQQETRDVAERIAGHMAQWFPVSWAALMNTDTQKGTE